MPTPIRLHPAPFRHIPVGARSDPGTTGEAGPTLAQAVALVLLARAASQEVEQDRLDAVDQERQRLEERAAKLGERAAQAWREAAKAAARSGDLQEDDTPRALTVVEVTSRIQRGQFLLRPDAEFNNVALGVIGRAQHFTGVHMGSIHILTGHLGMVLAVESPDQLADFTDRVFGQLGDRVCRLRNLRFRIWGRRNRSIVVDANATDVGARLRYNLANGAKEHLVAHPSQWPGVHSARFFCKGERMVGKWTDFTALGAARRRNPDISVEQFQTEYEVIHSKMPGLEHLSDDDYRALMVRWCDDIAADAAATRRAARLADPGDPLRLTRISFEHIPDSVEQSPAPSIHAHDPERRKLYRQLVRDHRERRRAVRQQIEGDLKTRRHDLPGQAIPLIGWRPVDPARVVPPPPILLPVPCSAICT